MLTQARRVTSRVGVNPSPSTQRLRDTLTPTGMGRSLENFVKYALHVIQLARVVYINQNFEKKVYSQKLSGLFQFWISLSRYIFTLQLTYT